MNKPTLEWEKQFDDQFDRFPDSYYNFVVGKDDTRWENTASDLTDFKQFISQQLTAFSEEIEEQVNHLENHSDSRAGELQVSEDGYVSGLEDTLEALSNLKQKWGIPE